MDRGKLIICMVFIFSLGTGGDSSVEDQNSEENKKCFTPNGDIGNCINIKRCPTLLYLLEYRRNNFSIATFLRNSMCGNDDNFPYYPKVCCLLEDEIYETISSIKLPSQDTCGRSNVIRNRIAGGRLAELGDWPWMAALGYVDISMINPEYEWNCGGSLISDRYVLTATHCTVGLGMTRLVIVRLGDLNLNSNEEDGANPIDVAISRVIRNNQYNSDKKKNDIALLKLKKSVEFGQFIQPICLPILSHHRATSLVESELFLVGWGSTMINPRSDPLMEVQVPVVDNSECKQIYNTYKINIDDTHLCAGRKGKNGCSGDSGGPLMWPNGSQFYLVGIMNFGNYDCNTTSVPPVFARVTSYLEWIADNMNYS
ncbi:venom protease-like isoform X1 [Metopolophium dirhodum]|nr:venom protease-like isoform X1 [Metopolophium dirhodum]